MKLESSFCVEKKYGIEMSIELVNSSESFRLVKLFHMKYPIWFIIIK